MAGLFDECWREPSRMVFERWGGSPDEPYRSGTPRDLRDRVGTPGVPQEVTPVEIPLAAERPIRAGLQVMGR
jgi:hypothetical protein